MKTLAAAAAALMLAAAGCGELQVTFVETEPRDDLARSMRTTFTLKFALERSGFLASLLGSDRIENPRLLYSLESSDFEGSRASFTDTGADFDLEARKAVWTIASPLSLYGRAATFVLTGDNVVRPAKRSVKFPDPGRITDVPVSWEGNSLVFSIRSQGPVFSPRFLLKLWNLPEKQLTVRERAAGEYVWFYPGEINPSDTRTPISFRIAYEDWYRKPVADSFMTTPMYIVPSVTFDSLMHDSQRPGTAVIVFKAWGKTGLVQFEYSSDGKTFAPAAGISDPVRTGETFKVFWDLRADGLEGYTGVLKLRALADGRFLGTADLLPPDPTIEITSAVQEEDKVKLSLKLGFVPPESVGVFAGSRNTQRELRADELLARTSESVVFRHADLPRDPGGRLYVFLSARNASGLRSAEKVVNIVSVKIRTVRQDGDRLVLEYGAEPPDIPVEVAYETAGGGETVKAETVSIRGGVAVWDFPRDLGTRRYAGPARVRLRAGAGDGWASDAAEVSLICAALGAPARTGQGAYVIPCSVSGSPDWMEFTWSQEGGPREAARGARLLPARDEIQWDIWSDLRQSTYDGKPVTLRMTLKGRYGSAWFDAAPVTPMYVRIAGSSQSGQEVTVNFEKSADVVKMAYFFSLASRGEFLPLAPARENGNSFAFEVSSLGKNYSTFVRIRIAGADAGGFTALDEASVRLVAGFEPSSAAWQGKYLWVSYSVGWKVTEDDVKFTCAPEAAWDKAVEATTPMNRVFDVNNRACAWDVFADMVRVGATSMDEMAFRIDIRDPDKGAFHSIISFDRLPKPPLRLEDTRVSLKNACLSFTFKRMARDASMPAFSAAEYRIDAEFFCPTTLKFRTAARAAAEPGPGEFVWDRKQSFDAVGRGTWVLLIVSRRNNPQTVGFALFKVKLEKDHPFFSEEEY